MDHSERDDLLHNLVYAYCRWRWLVLAAAALLFAMVVFITFLMTPTWTAEVHMVAESTLPPPSGKFADPTRAERQIVPGMYGEHVSRILQSAVDTLYVWHTRAQHRHELRSLLTRDDRIFQDIGRNREDIAWEAIKPFWQA